MTIAFVLLVLLILLFGFVLLFGAPYLPTLRKQIDDALGLLDLQPGQTLLELGSGDGRVMRLAAQRGINVVGYEINPLLVVISRIVTWKYRKRVTIIWGDFWSKEWPPNDGAFVFLIGRFMDRLDHKIKSSKHKPNQVVSFAFQIPSKKPVDTRTGLYLYKY